MEIRRLCKFDVLRIAREEGIVYGNVLMDSGRFIKLCHRLGFHPGGFVF